ncbi:MAG: hypothetical protein AAFY52_08575 [Pseudomonadota bacterium]
MHSLYFSDATWLTLFGFASAVVSVIAFLPYIRDTLSGKARPHRASWFIWSVLASIAFCAQAYEGATLTLWFAGAQAGMTIVICVISLTHGRGALLSRVDERALWLAAIGVVVWYFTDAAAYALAVTISVSLLGGVLTVAKAYRDPDTETMMKWALSVVASALALVALPVWDPVLLAYPLYILALNAAVVSAMLLGRVALARQVAYTRRTAPEMLAMPAFRAASYP